MKTTKGAQPAPIPFSELQANATQGPFGFEHNGVGRIYGKRYSFDPPNQNAIVTTNLPFDYETREYHTEISKSNADLITRLLNFAQAGGYNVVRALLEYTSPLPENPEPPTGCWAQTRALLSILDGDKREMLQILNGEESKL